MSESKELPSLTPEQIALREKIKKRLIKVLDHFIRAGQKHGGIEAASLFDALLMTIVHLALKVECDIEPIVNTLRAFYLEVKSVDQTATRQ